MLAEQKPVAGAGQRLRVSSRAGTDCPQGWRDTCHSSWDSAAGRQQPRAPAPTFPTQEPKISFPDSRAHISSQCRRGCPTRWDRPRCRDAPRYPHPTYPPTATHAADKREMCPAPCFCHPQLPRFNTIRPGEHLPRRILHPASFSHTHRYARGCPSRSHADAPNPTTHTTDLIFLFLNTQRSSPSAANPTEQGRETQSDLC